VFGDSCVDDSDVNTDCVGVGFTCCPATSTDASGVSAICVDDTNGNKDSWTAGGETYVNDSST